MSDEIKKTLEQDRADTAARSVLRSARTTLERPRNTTPASFGPRIIHPMEHPAIPSESVGTADDPVAVATFNRELRAAGISEQAPVGPSRPAVPSPTTTPPAPTGSGPLSEAESTPIPSGKGSGAQNAAGGGYLPISAVEREWRAVAASLTEERDEARRAWAAERSNRSERDTENIRLRRECDEERRCREEWRQSAEEFKNQANALDERVVALEKDAELMLAEGERARAQRDKYFKEKVAYWEKVEVLTAENVRLQRERDGMEKRLNETERKMAASWDEQKATQGLRERCASLEAERDAQRRIAADVSTALDAALESEDALKRERDASRRAEADADRTLEEVRATLIAERAQHEAFLRAFKFPADAHPLIAALMERMVRVMCMEAAGGACNPHAVVCAALDAAHNFAEQDGSPATEKLRDIVRVSAADVDRWKEREKDAETYHAEWMHQRDLADALAEQIGHAAAKRARKRAEKAVAMAERLRGRLMESIREEYDEEDPATDGERGDDDAF